MTTRPCRARSRNPPVRRTSGSLLNTWRRSGVSIRRGLRGASMSLHSLTCPPTIALCTLSLWIPIGLLLTSENRKVRLAARGVLAPTSHCHRPLAFAVAVQPVDRRIRQDLGRRKVRIPQNHVLLEVVILLLYQPHTWRSRLRKHWRVLRLAPYSLGRVGRKMRRPFSWLAVELHYACRLGLGTICGLSEPCVFRWQISRMGSKPRPWSKAPTETPESGVLSLARRPETEYARVDVDKSSST
ncbi:hypothetical protein V8D89_005711 [Ganoderma adspersum]